MPDDNANTHKIKIDVAELISAVKDESQTDIVPTTAYISRSTGEIIHIYDDRAGMMEICGPHYEDAVAEAARVTRNPDEWVKIPRAKHIWFSDYQKDRDGFYKALEEYAREFLAENSIDAEMASYL